MAKVSYKFSRAVHAQGAHARARTLLINSGDQSLKR